MCGIVGVVSSEAVDSGLVERMRDELAHRGPDAKGVWRSTDGRACFGHRRLAIIDLHPESNQPWVSGDGRFVVTFNGEIYNYLTLRRELAREGVVFRTSSDTEVLVESYRRWGEQCLTRLSGMFAFAIFDTIERRLFCARDRAGEKPFYYAALGDCFVFGSELKAVVQWPAFSRRLDCRAVADFLTLSFIPDPKTIWQDARKLPPGHSLLVELPAEGPPRVSTPQRWWDLVFDPDRGVGDWSPDILAALSRAADEMSISDVPLGTFLSGGVDSSSVTAALSRSGHDVRTFTIGFGEEAYDERPWARRVAEQYGTTHTERLLEPRDVDAVFDRMTWHFDEPFGDYSYFPTYYVSQAAREAITVALSGDGGDELFGGYRKYQRLALREQWSGALPRALAAAGARVLPAGSPHARMLRQHAASPEQMLFDFLLLGFTPDALRSCARGALASTLKEYDPIEVVRSHLRKADPQEVGLVNAMRYLDLKLTLAGGILVKVDRASMAVALEVRPVYLHRDLLDLAGRIPPDALADRRQAKKVLKKALEHWLPADLLYRRKMGFAMPLPLWLRGGLDGLSAGGGPGVADLLDPQLMADLLALHQSGRADVTANLHNLVFLDRWLRRWL